MITALDTSVLLDVLLDDQRYRPSSLEAHRAAHASGSLTVCPVVWAETSGAVKRPEGIAEAFEQVDITFNPFDQASPTWLAISGEPTAGGGAPAPASSPTSWWAHTPSFGLVASSRVIAASCAPTSRTSS